jgi:hypothetical protein
MYLIYTQKESQNITLCFSYRFHGIGNDATGHGYGFIQEYLGYGNFFIWVFIATIPGLILSRFLIFQRLWKEIRSNSEINVFQLVCINMTLEHKIGQFFFPAVFINDTEENIKATEMLIKKYNIGGLTFFIVELVRQPTMRKIKRLF